MKVILVIEDQQPIRNNIAIILNRSGFQAVEAENGTVGVQLAAAYLPDLIICDVMMPSLDGYGVLEQVRQNPETANIPFIFLTAKSDRSDMRQGMNLGADDYLTKPFTKDELVEAVSSRLKKQENLTQPYIEEMKRAAETLNKVAYCDPLTNLPNRILLRHRLQEALRQTRRQQQLVALLHLSLNKFSVINNTFGYTGGDAVLQTVAERLVQCGQPNKTVARLSGVEFCLILQGDLSQQEVEAAAVQVLKAITQPLSLNGESVHLQVSLGISLSSDSGSDPDRLLNHADLARRWCEHQGTKGYQFYEESLNQADAERRSLEADLGGALERSQFLLYYQPQVNLITGRMIGMEALLRWQHPTRGLVPPEKFVPLAEATDLIIPLGEWVLRTACAQAQQWQELSLLPLKVSVNLSGRQFKQKDLVQTIALALEDTRLNPKLLTVELTETSLIENVEATIETLQELKEMGVSISIDDFGTGYSSLSYLRRFPIDTLKIDRSFVSHLQENTHDSTIVKAVIALGQSLKLKVIAEGVETEEQMIFLRQQGCHAIQGYLYSRPLPAQEIQALLKEDRRLMSASA